MYATAREQSDAGEIIAAVSSYRMLLKLQPTHVRARNNLALLLEKRGDVDGAITELTQALTFEPDNVSVLNNRAAMLSARLRYEQAETDLRRALRLEENNAEALTNLGVVLCKSGRWRLAVEPLLRAVEIEPSKVAPHYYLGEAYNHIDQLPAALTAFETASRLQPTNWRAFKGVGNVLDRMGRPVEAAVAHQRARDVQRR
jgi:Flp pilus assembly protein TadD